MRKDYFESTYSLRIRLVFISVMLFLIGLFYAFPKIIESTIIIEESEYTEILEVELVTQIQPQTQIKSARPAIPIEADEDQEIDSLDFMDTDIENFDDFLIIQKKTKKRGFQGKPERVPKVKGKLAPRYPPICKNAGVRGSVTVEFFVDENGIVDPNDIKILNSVPCLDDEVISVIKKSKWKPARMGKKKVGIYVKKTFTFGLSTN